VLEHWSLAIALWLGEKDLEQYRDFLANHRYSARLMLAGYHPWAKVILE
jgi:hypothetical protein